MQDTRRSEAKAVTLRCQFCLKLNRIDLGRAAERPRCGECNRPMLLDRPVKISGEDFDRLVVSIYHHGILCPLITHRGHVLIGQRRAEIGQRFGIETVECWDVQEDVTLWWRPDVARLDQLKRKVGEVVY